MNRGALNLYLEGFLSLSQDRDLARLPLVREAISASSIVELLQEWVWLQELDQSHALKLKVWFQLSYKELSEVMGLSVREIGQLLRNQRLALLPTYRPEKPPADGMSCFMVEQHLSLWVDAEIPDAKTVEKIAIHLRACVDCHNRLQEFRDLQALILNSRLRAPEMTEGEWKKAVHHFKVGGRRRVFKVVVVGVVVLTTSSLLAWEIFSKPEKMPNVYEIQG